MPTALIVCVALQDTPSPTTLYASTKTAKWAADIASYYREGSFGKIDFAITVSPIVTVNFTKLTLSVQTQYQMQAEANALLQAQGISQFVFDRVLYYTPSANTPGAKGYNGGRTSWIACADTDYCTFAAFHELGHSYGLGHSGRIAKAGQYVGEYGSGTYHFPPLIGGSIVEFNALYDDYTSMGYANTSVHFHAHEKRANLAWITAAQFPSYVRGAPQNYTLCPLSVAGGEIYGVRIPMGQYNTSSYRWYSIEYRQPIGWDYRYVSKTKSQGGIVICMHSDTSLRVAQAVINCHPNMGLGSSAFALTVGEAFTDGSVTIQVVGPGQIQVRDADAVAIPPPPPPPPPDPNIATLAALQPLVAAMTPTTVTQAQKDSAAALVAALIVT